MERKDDSVPACFLAAALLTPSGCHLSIQIICRFDLAFEDLGFSTVWILVTQSVTKSEGPLPLGSVWGHFSGLEISRINIEVHDDCYYHLQNLPSGIPCLLNSSLHL